jgi:hypothetical protein
LRSTADPAIAADSLREESADWRCRRISASNRAWKSVVAGIGAMGKTLFGFMLGTSARGGDVNRITG